MVPMQAAKRKGIPFVVLDRPNPITDAQDEVVATTVGTYQVRRLG